MPAADGATPRVLNLFVFSLLGFAAAFVWDVAYGSASDHLPPGSFAALPFWLPLLVAPCLLCVGIGYVTGQWRSLASGVAQAGAAAWCVVAPILALFAFFAFMCFAFHSCMGD